MGTAGRLTVTVRFGPAVDVSIVLHELLSALKEGCQWRPAAVVRMHQGPLGPAAMGTHGPYAEPLALESESMVAAADEVEDAGRGLSDLPNLTPWEGIVLPPERHETQRWHGRSRWWIATPGSGAEPSLQLLWRQRLHQRLGGQLVPPLWLQIDYNPKGLQVLIQSRATLWLSADTYDEERGEWVSDSPSRPEAARRNLRRLADLLEGWLTAVSSQPLLKVVVEPIHPPHSLEQGAIVAPFAALPLLDRWWEFTMPERPRGTPPPSLFDGMEQLR